MEDELEDAAMVGSEQVDQFVDNNVFSQVSGHAEQSGIKGEPAGGRDHSPLGFEASLVPF